MTDKTLQSTKAAQGSKAAVAKTVVKKKAAPQKGNKKVEPKEEKKKNLGREIMGWIVYFLCIAAFVYCVITFVGQRTKVDGNSMNPTLSDGDNLIIDKISYRFRDPSRYDVIVFPYQHEEDVYYIKRIIGLPGETVQIIEGYVYINGELLEEDFGKELIEDPQLAADPITLGEDEYFVLGDNRNHSQDSRDPSVGVLSRDLLVGRAWVRIFPFDKIGVVRHEHE
ncbi:MAG: signal peptidase I [Coprococcus sp.]|nr:signal peptidase I [Coprococcus sp.]